MDCDTSPEVFYNNFLDDDEDDSEEENDISRHMNDSNQPTKTDYRQTGLDNKGDKSSLSSEIGGVGTGVLSNSAELNGNTNCHDLSTNIQINIDISHKECDRGTSDDLEDNSGLCDIDGLNSGYSVESRAGKANGDGSVQSSDGITEAGASFNLTALTASTGLSVKSEVNKEHAVGSLDSAISEANVDGLLQPGNGKASSDCSFQSAVGKEKADDCISSATGKIMAEDSLTSAFGEVDADNLSDSALRDAYGENSVEYSFGETNAEGSLDPSVSEAKVKSKVRTANVGETVRSEFNIIKAGDSLNSVVNSLNENGPVKSGSVHSAVDEAKANLLKDSTVNIANTGGSVESAVGKTNADDSVDLTISKANTGCFIKSVTEQSDVTTHSSDINPSQHLKQVFEIGNITERNEVLNETDNAGLDCVSSFNVAESRNSSLFAGDKVNEISSFRNNCTKEVTEAKDKYAFENHEMNGQLETGVHANVFNQEENATSKLETTQSRKFIVGFFAGDIEDILGCSSVAKRKMDRLTVRLPRNFHTRETTKPTAWSDLRKREVDPTLLRTPAAILSAYAEEHDYELSYVIENVEQLGVKAHFSCMQCYDQHGHAALFSRTATKPPAQSGDSICSNCGAQKMNMVTYCNMLMQLKKKFKENGLIVRDVSGEGNCLFAAIVDQLRVRGDFRFTKENLRIAAVEYLRNNPTAEDGTSYAMFLTGETWNQYLLRMSRDGEWGDHLMLNAISNLLNKQIKIFGGRTGEGVTDIVPRRHVKAESFREDGFSEAQQPNTDSKRTGSEKQVDNEENKADAQDSNGSEHGEACLFLGHIRESHYISLTWKDWRARLEKDLKDQVKRQKNGNPSLQETDLDSNVDAYCDTSDVKSWQPMLHVNTIVRQLLQGDYIKSKDERVFETVENTSKFGLAVSSYEGDKVNRLSPYAIPIKSILQTGSKLFLDKSTECLDELHIDNDYLNALIFITTTDTEVVETAALGQRFDLVLDTVSEEHDVVRLQPIKPSAWKGRSVSVNEDKTYLETFSLDFFPSVTPRKYKSILAFHFRWPDKANEWRARKRESGWPDSKTIEMVNDQGVHIIPADIPDLVGILDEPDYIRTLQSDKSLWLLSFAAAEREIARFIPESARNCFLLFRLLLDSCLKEYGGLPTSCLKHTFFHACEVIQSDRWKKEPGNCVMYLLKRLEFSLKTQLPHYFCPQKNLIQSISKDKLAYCLQQTELLVSQPMLGIFLLMDEKELNITELGPLLDDLIEDVSRFNRHREIQRSVEDAIIPGLYALLQDYALQGDFEKAMKVTYEISNLLKDPESSDCLVSIMNTALEKFNIGHLWCLALYIELVTDRKELTTKVCEGYKTVSIREVLGPDIVDKIGEKDVPETFSIYHGSFFFPSKVADVLDASGNTKLSAKYLRYFIETFHDVFGDGPYAGGVTLCPCSACNLSIVFSLLDFYARLYNTYCAMYCPSEIRELIPRIIKLTEMSRNTTYLQNLIIYLTSVGDVQRAQEFLMKRQALLASPCEDSLVCEYSSGR